MWLTQILILILNIGDRALFRLKYCMKKKYILMCFPLFVCAPKANDYDYNDNATFEFITNYILLCLCVSFWGTLNDVTHQGGGGSCVPRYPGVSWRLQGRHQEPQFESFYTFPFQDYFYFKFPGISFLHVTATCHP